MSEATQLSCKVVRSQELGTYEGKQGMTYFAGISKETAGAQHLCLNLLTIPPGQRARVHLHESHESAIYILSGSAELWHGEQLQHHTILRTGDFVYIPAGIPHFPWNSSQTEACVTLVARTDPNEQESVVLLPELEQRFLKAEAYEAR